MYGRKDMLFPCGCSLLDKCVSVPNEVAEAGVMGGFPKVQLQHFAHRKTAHLLAGVDKVWPDRQKMSHILMR